MDGNRTSTGRLRSIILARIVSRQLSYSVSPKSWNSSRRHKPRHTFIFVRLSVELPFVPFVCIAVTKIDRDSTKERCGGTAKRSDVSLLVFWQKDDPILSRGTTGIRTRSLSTLGTDDDDKYRGDETHMYACMSIMGWYNELKCWSNMPGIKRNTTMVQLESILTFSSIDFRIMHVHLFFATTMGILNVQMKYGRVLCIALVFTCRCVVTSSVLVIDKLLLQNNKLTFCRISRTCIYQLCC